MTSAYDDSDQIGESILLFLSFRGSNDNSRKLSSNIDSETGASNDLVLFITSVKPL